MGLMKQQFTPAAARALADLAAARPVIVTGSTSGAFVMMDAAAVTPDWINLMAARMRGLIGLAIPLRQADALGLGLQPRRGRQGGPLYTASIEARLGISTGISAGDRALTILTAVGGSRDDIVTPGHVFPHLPEGDPRGMADLALRLLALAGPAKGAVTCVLLDDTGEIADTTHATHLAAELGLACVAADDVI